MAVENCDKCKAFGITCERGGLFQRWTGREKIVTIEKTGQQFAHDFPIEDCEVVKGEVPAEKYAKLLIKYVDARNRGLIYPL